MKQGNLFIVSTPIGNYDDITLRAIKVLNQVSYIACEDTRVTSKLLKHLQISKSLIAYNDFNETSKTDYIISLLKEGNDIALVSDAGTPMISDPGYRVTQACLKNNIKVVTLPGACSIISALTICMLPIKNFVFLGFLDKSSTKKQKTFKEYTTDKNTLVAFESPKRLVKTLQDIKEVYGASQTVSVIKEITKTYENVTLNTVDILINKYEEAPPLGEFIIIFNPTQIAHSEDEVDKFINENINKYSASKLAKMVSKQFNLDKSLIYEKISRNK